MNHMRCHKSLNKIPREIICFASLFAYATTSGAPQELDSKVPAAALAGEESRLGPEFAKLIASLNPQLKSTPRAEWEMVNKLVNGLDTHAQEEELGRIVRQPQSAWTNEFDAVLLEVFVDRFLKAREFARVERILAQRCPAYIGSVPIEFKLVHDRGPDGVLMLGRAFAAAGTNASSKAVITSLSHGFPSLRAQHPADREFVAACEDWAKHPGTNWTLNWDYPYFPSSGLPRTADDPVWKVGLIVAKDKVAGKQPPQH